ncbi:hypothetical protein [Streptomyces sp. NPDC026589]|uniref:hypothetical protein n=1 Tax=Streptomyces sp. NPDC026589 TaxID=3155609 RepID=UPI0033CDE432
MSRLPSPPDPLALATAPVPAVPAVPAPCAAAVREPAVVWRPEVLEAVRATPAPWYAVAYPATHGGWHISLLQAGGIVRDSFTAGGLDTADHELQCRGYLSLASAMCRDWDRLTRRRDEQGCGTPVFLDPGADA